MAAAAEGSPPGAGTAAANWFTMLLSPLEKLTSRLTISLNKERPPPVLPISISTQLTVSPPGHEQQPNVNNELHPIIQMMREQELGRVIMTLAVPAAVAILMSGNGKLLAHHLVVVGLMMGCMAIWNGILFRTTFPRLANVLEQVGISLVLLSIHAHVSSFLPKGLSWVLWLSGALCLLPFLLAPIARETAIGPWRMRSDIHKLLTAVVVLLIICHAVPINPFLLIIFS